MMARSLAFLFAAGATLSLVVLLALPHPEADVTGMAATIALAYCAALMMLRAHARIDVAAYPWLVAFGTGLITAGIHFRGTQTAVHALL